MRNCIFYSLILTTFLIGYTSYGQVRFNSINPPGNNEPNLIVTDTGYIVLQQGYPQVASLFKMYFDTQGTYLKTDTLEFDYFYEDCKNCLEPFGSGYIKAGTFFYSNDSAETSLLHFDSNLDTIRSTTYSLFDELTSDAFGLITIDSNRIVLVGEYFKKSSLSYWMFMTMFDDSLNVVWEKYFRILGGNQPGGLTATNIIRTSDGGYMIGGYADIYPIDLLAGIILKTDSLGNEEWRISLNAQEANKEVLLFDLNNGYTLFATATCDERDSISNDLICQPRIGMIDYNGTIVADRVSGPKSYNLTLEFFKQTVDSNYIVGGYAQSLGLASYVMKIKSSGDSLWFRRLAYNNHGFPDLGYMQWVSQTSDSGFVFAGYFLDQSPGGNGANAWLVKTDKYGCDVVGCQNLSEKRYTGQLSGFSIYPNPVKTKIFLHNSNGFKATSCIILSVNGRRLFSSSLENNSLIVDFLPAGIFFIEVEGPLGVERIRFIKT